MNIQKITAMNSIAVSEKAAFSKECPYGIMGASTPGRCMGKECHAWNNVDDVRGYCIRIAADVATAITAMWKD